MGEYIIDHKKEFEIFLRTEANLKKGLFPIMSKFGNEEINLWIKIIKKNISRKDKILEMGCGSGRVLRKLEDKGYSAIGFDNNKLFVEYCKKQGLNVFYFDSTHQVPIKHKNKYKIVGIALNTLFNFDKKVRGKWIKTASKLCTKDGFLIFSAYLDSKFARSTIPERKNYFRSDFKFLFKSPKKYVLEFFENPDKRGFHLTDSAGKVEWQSLWVKKQELIKEIKTWKEFKIEKIEKMKCNVAYNVLLKIN